MTFGSGEFTYEVADGWAKRPRKWPFVEVAGVAVDSKDQVCVFSRSAHPVTVFDRDGNFLDWWGGDIFDIPHGIHTGPDDTVYCADTGDHTVRIFTPEGKLLQTLGTENLNAPEQSGKPFNRPTHLAVDLRTGDWYISDGYGNSRIHKYSPDGHLISGWGEPGSGPGQFQTPHSVCLDRYSRVYVCDRTNNRIQIFTTAGEFITQ